MHERDTCLENVQHKVIWILGENGRLANAVYEEYAEEEPRKIGKQDYLKWLDLSIADLESYFRKNLPSKSIIFVTAGIVDKSVSPEVIEQINVLLPVKILEASKNLDLITITIGSISEHFLAHDDLYIKSKRDLSYYIRTHETIKNNLHVRLHTLYGGSTPPHVNMFLGNAFESIQNRRVFKMSSGQQLREYHHVNDVARAIRIRLSKNQFGVWDLSTGKPVRLIDLAEAIFLSYDLEDLITISREKDLLGDNLTHVFQDTITELGIEMRESTQGVISYLRSMDRDTN
jgi:nucleoside-diphosphate-sugar epimerase